jgi:6-phosphofructokinase
VFLPPYSPDFNPIEQAFSAIKAYLKRRWNDFSLGVMGRACSDITAQAAWGFMKASGYVV